jgi:hypothetical protein
MIEKLESVLRRADKYNYILVPACIAAFFANCFVMINKGESPDKFHRKYFSWAQKLEIADNDTTKNGVSHLTNIENVSNQTRDVRNSVSETIESDHESEIIAHNSESKPGMQ